MSVKSFTAEAADNMRPAAAEEEPGEEERLRGRTREACWSCDRSTYPWPCLAESGKGLRRLGSCTERSYHCFKEEEEKEKTRNLE